MEMPKSVEAVRDKPVERFDVDAVNKKENRNLYAGRKKVYAKRATGYFRNLKWTVMVVCLAIYYLVPWIRWDRGPDLPNQAVLLDMQHERFFLFGLEIWPQEFYFVTGLLVLAALGLFLVTSLLGRVWCGYFCWQTVWTDLMIAVERFFQGDRNNRIRLDKAPWSFDKIWRKLATHVTWIVIALLTGGAFVFYFADAPTLAMQLMSGTAPYTAYVFVGILTAATYVLGGIAREQVCIYMCPWPRIQGAMVDHDSMLISYRDWRGEPRGAHKKGQSWDGRGDCVDCKACVVVCPMGIDIRDGSQLECIQCALCVDACNEVMSKVGRPANLIAYDTIANREAALKGTTSAPHFMRPRTLIYLSMLGIVGAIMLYALSQRTVLEVNVIQDRNPFFVQLANGDIRNGYSVKILNKLHEPRKYMLTAEGLPGGSKITVVGMEKDPKPVIDVPTDVLREIQVYLALPAQAAAGLSSTSAPFNFVVRDIESGLEARRATYFRRP